MRLLQLPRFGQIMERGTILKWHVADGAAFKTGDVLYEVETEKTTVTVEATFDGVLARRLVPEDENVPVGTILAVCWEAGEEPDPAALERAVHAAAAPQAGTTGAAGPRITPRAKRLAEKHGLDYAALTGSGPGGIIQEADVRAALERAGLERRGAAPAATEGEGAGARGGNVLRQTSVQRAMAAAMQRSWNEIPQFVQTRSFDALKLVELREELKAAGRSIGFTDLIAHVAARVVPDHPLVNATYRGDGEVVVHPDVELAVAVETERGLLAPVLHKAQALTLEQTAAALRELTSRARAGTLRPEQAQGGTISLSNLGMFGIEWGTPIINPPQSCVIFVGALRERLVLRDGRPVAMPVAALSIGFDHRVLDGATAARFTADLCAALEDPGAVVRLG